MKKEYLKDTQLVFLKRILLDKYTVCNDSIKLDYQSLEKIENCGINALLILYDLEKVLDIKMTVEMSDKAYSIFESVYEFLKLDSVIPLGKVAEIKMPISKDKISEYLDKYILDYENGMLVGVNIFSRKVRDDYFLELLESFKNIEQANLVIDAKVLFNSGLSELQRKEHGQMRLLEHFLLFEKKKHITIQDIDFSEKDSTIPWKITITITTSLSEIARSEKVSFQEPIESSKDSIVGKFELDDKNKMLKCRNKVINLGILECLILNILMNHPDRSSGLTKREIREAVVIKIESLDSNERNKLKKMPDEKSVSDSINRINEKAQEEFSGFDVNQLISYDRKKRTHIFNY